MITRVTNASLQRNILLDLNSVDAKLTRTQQRAASGKQITKPSDDPYAAAQAMNLRRDLAANRQYQSSVQDGEGWQEATETALSDITDFAKRARDLLVQGGSDTVDPASRSAIADEIDQIIQGVKQSANSNYRGSYLFSGSKTDTPPYQMGDVDTYQGDDAGLDPAVPGVLREIGPGVVMTINTVGREVLGGSATPGDGGILDTLRKVSSDLRSGDATSLRGDDLQALDANVDSLLAVRARNGARSNRLEAADTRLSQLQETITSQLSGTEDADLAQTLIDFSSQSAAYQAALKAGANIVQNSLLDFLR